MVSPLLSLITDQCAHLSKLDILAIAYTGDLSAADKRIAKSELERHEPYTKIVYITPEMLKASQATRDLIKALHARKRLARFVIDEAHCLSSVSRSVSSMVVSTSRLYLVYIWNGNSGDMM